MQAIRHDDHPPEAWRPGVTTRMQVSGVTGARHLCVFEQWIEPGAGAPTHRHPVEEILTVLDGVADLWLGTTHLRLERGQSVVVPEGESHGFTNAGTGMLHMSAILASPVFEAFFDDGQAVRRWNAPAADTQDQSKRIT
ncbi:cupin domain-containing protein [Albidovulum sediminicola]|uniref:Cupin domain-containing protein n=1 Tax=Albidovulum sediminicola TaxID=2984331 RepID=A0ABT2Z1A3_9RHOB|nr:cupin domain-containing protein [Defluviimonas sp. WL0075]MCV2864876.1 cupin domain-containing protein [Defluviimonas sp. WL0075]